MKKPTLSPIKKAVLGMIALSIAVGLYFTACQRPPQSVAEPVYAETNSAMSSFSQSETNPNAPKTGIKKADFPLYLDNVPSILHPITPVETGDKGSKMASKYDERNEFNQANYFSEASPYEFRGEIYNLVFEDIKSGATQRLFPQDNFVIGSMVAPYVDLPLAKTVENLKNDPNKTQNPTDNTAQATATMVAEQAQPVTEQSKRTLANDKKLMGYFIYQVQEKPINDEDKSNLDRQQSLYLSDFSGKNLVKLHPDTEFVKSVAWLPELERYYFITQNDSNNDKNITIDDTYHNYVIDFKQARDSQTLPKAVVYRLLK